VAVELRPSPPLQTEDAITVAVPWSGSELDQFEPVVEAFEEEYDVDVLLATQRAEDLVEVLPAQFRASTAAADVIMM